MTTLRSLLLLAVGLAFLVAGWFLVAPHFFTTDWLISARSPWVIGDSSGHRVGDVAHRVQRPRDDPPDGRITGAGFATRPSRRSDRQSKLGLDLARRRLNRVVDRDPVPWGLRRRRWPAARDGRADRRSEQFRPYRRRQSAVDSIAWGLVDRACAPPRRWLHRPAGARLQPATARQDRLLRSRPTGANAARLRERPGKRSAHPRCVQ
jgi:hypothetical protein